MLSCVLEENIKKARQIFAIGESFDYIERNLFLGSTRAYLLTINGFAQTVVLQRIISDLQNCSFVKDDSIKNCRKYVNSCIGYAQVEFVSDWNRIERMLLSGTCLLLFDGCSEGIIMDTRAYPVRGTEEPDTEKVTRGAKDGFVENFLVNTTLIRRRIRNPRLTFSLQTVGTDSKSDVVIAYIGGKVKPELVNRLKEKISSLQVTSLTLGIKTLEELLAPRSFLHPLPGAHFTERPDVACSFLEEGYIVLLADNSPMAMILPCSVFQFLQSPEDYYKSPPVGNYIRLIRFGCAVLCLLLLPCLLLFGVHFRLPEAFDVLVTAEVPPLKLFILVLAMEVGLELFRYATSHTSDRFAGALSIVGGLIIGEVAIDLNWATPEILFYGAATMLVTLALPSLEFAEGLRIYRIFLCILTWLFGGAGLAAGLGLVMISAATTPTVLGTSYLWPLLPFHGKALVSLLWRRHTRNAQPIRNNGKPKIKK